MSAGVLIKGEETIEKWLSRGGGAEERTLGSGDDASTELSKSEIFDVLRNRRRRAAISYLLAERRELSVSELTERVATAEYDATAEEISAEQHKRIYTGLYQCHLPRLEEFGVIDFERETNTVTLRAAASQVEPYLDHGRYSASTRFELAAALIVAPLVALGVSGVGPFEGAPAITWVAITVLALVGVAVFQLYERELSLGE